MRKLLLIVIVLLGLNGYGQKIFEVYNFSAQTVTITDIFTNTTGASGAYPEFHAPGITITLLPGTSYVLQNTANLTRFPFHSPASLPYITTWERFISSTISTYMPSANAWTLGSPQVFYRMTFNAGGLGYSIGPTNPTITTSTFTAVYDMFTSGAVITYTIVIF